MQALGLAYKHVPLISDGSTFRIITIFPAKEDERIECSFLEVPKSSKPTFSALSYTWGDDTTTGHVWISGRVMRIRANLNNALKRLRDTERPQGFWIDALCIDQDDEAGEKSTQIPLMRHIYHSSHLVTIYLGEEHNESALMPSLFDRIDSAYDQPGVFENEVFAKQKALSSSRYEELGLPSPSNAIWEAFRLLLSRDWFTRVWIIQETILATSAKVVCGQWNMKWTRFLCTVLKAHALSPAIFSNEAKINSQSTRPGNPFISVTQLLFFNALKPADTEFIPWKLIDLLHHIRTSLATRRHDYCYGVLGISAELGDSKLKVDYSLPVEAVYRHFARHFVAQGDGVKVLYNASEHNLDLPSWVPDWSHRHISLPRIVPQPQRESVPNPAVAAASSFSSVIQLHPSDPDILRVRGLVFGILEELGGIHQSFRMNRTRKACTPVPACTKVTIANCDNSLPENKDKQKEFASISLVADCITELYQLLCGGRLSRYPTGEALETVVWRTLICNHARRSGGKAPPIYENLYRSLLFLIKGFDARMQIPPRPYLDSISLEDVLKQDPLEVVSNATVITSQASGLCSSKRRGRTDHGYVGQFSLDAQVGDYVFIPLGSAVPFVIRRRSNNAYKLIGECYVHGIMEGEAFESLQTGVVDLDFE